MNGMCGCPDGRLDLDGVAETGCECAIDPETGPVGSTCAMPITLGQLSDAGETTTASGNALPAGREVWYSLVARDAADTTCDNFHFRAQFTDNPDDAYRFEVRRGSCDVAGCNADAMGSTDYSWATDFRASVAGRLAGQCPCSNASRPPSNVSACENDTATYYIRVWRREGVADACAPYVLELSNGVYDTP